MIEIWKDIENYEGLYQISNWGRVKSLPKSWLKYDGGILHQKELILKPRPTTVGYLRVCLRKDNHSKDFYIHRLVGLAFLPNPHNYSEINHIDENKTNNNVDNLEWCSRCQNNNWGSHNISGAKKRGKPVMQYDTNGNLISVYESGKKASREVGVDSSLIRECCKGTYKQAGGYIWKYKQ